MLGLLLMAQVPTLGPKAGPPPKPAVVIRTGDGTVLGAIGARDANVIEVAKLATTKASGASAKSLAAAVLKAHELSLTAGTKLAKQLGLTRVLPADSVMARAQVTTMAELNVLSGTAFDQAFVQFIVTDHKAAITLLNGTLLAQAKNPQVRTFVRQRVPILKSHQVTGEKWLVDHP
jgi:predicted outer membrane protein